MHDNSEFKINCPACGKEMEKIFMPAQGIHLDVCTNGCGGIYFDNRELSRFDEPFEDISPLQKVFEGKEFIKVDDDQIRNCPVCGNRMMKNFTSITHEVQIDECYHCGGKFLDHGELEKMRSQYNTEKERAEDIMKNLYKEVGSEIISSHYIPKRKTSYVIQGLLIGIVLSVIYLIIDMDLILSPQINPEVLSSVSKNVFMIILASALITLGIGSLKK